MKKIISVFLSVLMLFGLCSVAASAAEADELVITVANDLHYNTTYTALSSHKANSLNEDFAHVGLDTRLPYEAKAIINAFVEQVKASNTDCLIIPGDITDRGREAEVAYMVDLFREIEAAGIDVYVVPGNHDVVERSKAQFMADYADFGYNEAKEKDTKSASYVVDLNDEYRLIAIDSTTEGSGAHSVYEERLSWIAEQGEKAKADGKKLIGMHHQNFLDHMLMSNLVQPNGVVSAKSKNAPEVYAKAGIKYVFTGHTHDHDITAYTAEDGTVIYDAVTGSLNALGSFYRVVTFGDTVKFETKSVDKIDVSTLPGCISDNAKAIAQEDFYKYQEISTNLSYYLVFNHYTQPQRLSSFLNVDDPEMKAIIDKVTVKLNEALNMPFAKADETEEGKSIESIIGQYDLTIPETEYKNILELAVTIHQAHNLGDESYPAYSDEVILITRGIGAALGYTLSDVSGEDYARVMSFITKLAGVEIPVDFLIYAGNGMTRFEGIEVLMTTVLLPLVTEFANDDAPGDRNVTLPGYAELVEAEKELTFFEKLINFFKMIIDTVKTVFTFFPFFGK
ncbi:MAG: metallophosphoesterase [Clostridia bacterium]|nr:metallophosphoesterase [Clostridia bacterium]